MKTRTQKIFLDDRGSFLGRGEGCLIVRDRNGKVEKYPLFENEIGEIHVRVGNSISSAALMTAAFWGIDTLILTQRGNPVAYLKSLDDDSHVATRVAQYESLKKSLSIAKRLVFAKLEGQNHLLRKYGLRQHDIMRLKDSIEKADSTNRLLSIEGHASDFYFNQIFQMLPQAETFGRRRRTYKAYDGINNTFNLAYTVLKWKVLRALIKAKLEPFLGFLHSQQKGKPSLACDMMEPYRYVIDDFLIKYCRELKKKQFTTKHEQYSTKRLGERQYHNKESTKDFMTKLNGLFETVVEIPRIRYGNRQTFETLISEEALLLAKYVRKERKDWSPRTFSL
jgi:CRISPR-associated protein Cas1